MRVKKLLDGSITVEDEPTVLLGEYADEFVADAHRRENEGMTEEQRRFQAECRRAYESAWAERSTR